MRIVLLLLAACLCQAVELPAGTYSCIYAPTDGTTQEVVMALTRNHDGTLVMRADGHPEVFTGRLVGDTLYLVHQRIEDKGLTVVQVIATVGPDGYAAGSAFRSLNAEAMRKSNFILKKAP